MHCQKIPQGKVQGLRSEIAYPHKLTYHTTNISASSNNECRGGPQCSFNTILNDLFINKSTDCICGGGAFCVCGGGGNR